jgi:hypothetical protein
MEPLAPTTAANILTVWTAARYVEPYLYLYGTKGRQNWRAVLSIIGFAKWGTAAFLGW